MYHCKKKKKKSEKIMRFDDKQHEIERKMKFERQ